MLPRLKFLAFLAFTLISFGAYAQDANFGLQERFSMVEGDSIVEPNKKDVQTHTRSIVFLDTQIPLNRIVRNDSLQHYFAVIYKSEIEGIIERMRQSQKVNGYKSIDSNDREFEVFKTEDDQVLVFYHEPYHETKICINTLAETEQTANSFFQNIDSWLPRIKSR